MKRYILIVPLLLLGSILHAQYATRHYIAPSPWQYWSDANEVVISTKEAGQITVELTKSDGVFITNLTVTAGNPVSYRFSGDPLNRARNSANIIYADRGLIVKASAPILVNLRNIASDSPGTGAQTIKGNASLVSFGDEGIGTAFRLGYYRVSYTGISSGAPIYSVMALENNTIIYLDGTPEATLNAGESILLYADMGALLTADKPVVANTGTYGDTPQACGGSGEDGAVDQIAPINKLGMQYILVRGNGTPGTSVNHPEQSIIIASQDNTSVQITHYTAAGIEISTASQLVQSAGGFINLFHGDAQNAYSSTLVIADKPVVVYSASAVECETDISTVLPLGGCSGATNISTNKFVNYAGSDLPYFGYVILESAMNTVYVNGEDMESVTGNERVQIGNTGFYMLRFNNLALGSPDSITITSDSRLTTSIIQQGDGFSMSGFFSAFSNAPDPPSTATAENCSITLSTSPGSGPYAWYIDGILIEGAIDAEYTIQQTGNYTVTATAECGITPQSAPVYAVAAPPVTATAPAETVQCLDLLNGNTFTLSSFDSEILGGQDSGNYAVTYHLSSNDATAGLNPVTESRITDNRSVTIFARVSDLSVSCFAITSFTLVVTSIAIDMPSEYSFCTGGLATITAPSGFLSYAWSTGETTQTINIDSAGNITLLVTGEVEGRICQATKEITVTESWPPAIKEVLLSDWTSQNNSIIVVPESAGEFEYSLDGVTYQDNPGFYELAPGAYTVFARDKKGCGSARYDVYLLMYPNFFTPNGDGIHENWRIKHADFEPGMWVSIFDRYGKFITGFDGRHAGWDGTFNGAKLPASDYWFVVDRVDGKRQRGHFSLKR